MVILRNSKSPRNAKDEAKEKVERKIFKTWQEIIAYLNIDTVELPWNVNGEMALKALRAKYSKQFRELDNVFLDDVVDAYCDRSTSDQLAALGQAMQELKLRFCQLNIPLNGSSAYTVFAVEADDTSDYLNRWKEVLTRRQFFRSIDTFELRHGETLDNPSEDVRIAMQSVQITGFAGDRRSVYVLDGRFLVAPFETYERHIAEPIIQVRVYDIRNWPIREVQKAKLSYDCYDIEPYTLQIETEEGEIIVYLGDDPRRDRSWKKGVLNDKGQYIPVYEDDDDEDDRWKGLKIGTPSPDKIPDIEDAVPWFTLNERIIYYYDNDDLANRQDEDDNNIRRRREQRRQRNTLLEYNTVDHQYRIMSLPGAGYIDRDDLVLYKNQWIIIPDSIFSRDASYVLRLWNPFTSECLRVTKNDMGCHDIEQIIPTADGDILILLDDGRLCHFDEDLVTWLKSDLLQHSVTLDDWQEEIKRDFENFPDTNYRFRRLRRDISDRILVTFADGKTLDIQLNEDKTNDSRRLPPRRLI